MIHALTVGVPPASYNHISYIKFDSLLYREAMARPSTTNSKMQVLVERVYTSIL